MISLFIASIFFVAYTYILYPIILRLSVFIVRRSREPVLEERHGFEPTFSMTITAYNEEDAIEEKLVNCLELDYPKELIEFAVGSDGSTDRTNELVGRYSHSDSRIRLFDFSRREGKASVLNKMIPNLKSEIVIFSDADTVYERDSIKKLVRHFLDPKVGGVCGRLMLTGDARVSCSEEGLYWSYENKIKELESSIKTITSINGQIFAIRRELFEPLPVDSITEDQVLGMKIIEKGYNILFEPEAVCREKALSIKGEFLRRIRISAGNFQSIAWSKKVLSPKMGFASFALWSHKILRWFVPFFLIAIFTSNISLLKTPFFKFTFFAQIIFYLISIIYYGLTKFGIHLKPLQTMYYFNLMNLAILIGFFKYLTKTQKVTWEKAR